MSIFSNSSHLEWRAGLSDTTLKGDHPMIIPAKFALIWFSGYYEIKITSKSFAQKFELK
jgi:hypothetical protein